jgi:NAD(P)-dependent dehydrogenase (short-subunit alcohol dehydrogenase family)
MTILYATISGLSDALDAALAVPLAERGYAKAQPELVSDLFVIGIAANIPDAELLTTDSEKWWTAVELPIMELFRQVRECSEGMIVRGKGRIVVVCDDAGVSGRRNGSAAAAVSGAAIAVVKGFARELAPHGIAVNAVCTPVMSVSVTSFNRIIKSEAIEAAYAVAFAAERGLPSLVGQIIVCNGGATRARG